MKVLKSVVLGVVLFSGLSAASAQEIFHVGGTGQLTVPRKGSPDLRLGAVTVSFEEFQQLLDAATDRDRDGSIRVLLDGTRIESESYCPIRIKKARTIVSGNNGAEIHTLNAVSWPYDNCPGTNIPQTSALIEVEGNDIELHGLRLSAQSMNIAGIVLRSAPERRSIKTLSDIEFENQEWRGIAVQLLGSNDPSFIPPEVGSIERLHASVPYAYSTGIEVLEGHIGSIKDSSVDLGGGNAFGIFVGDTYRSPARVDSVDGFVVRAKKNAGNISGIKGTGVVKLIRNLSLEQESGGSAGLMYLNVVADPGDPGVSIENVKSAASTENLPWAAVSGAIASIKDLELSARGFASISSSTAMTIANVHTGRLEVHTAAPASLSQITSVYAFLYGTFATVKGVNAERLLIENATITSLEDVDINDQSTFTGVKCGLSVTNSVVENFFNAMITAPFCTYGIWIDSNSLVGVLASIDINRPQGGVCLKNDAEVLVTDGVRCASPLDSN